MCAFLFVDYRQIYLLLYIMLSMYYLKSQIFFFYLFASILFKLRCEKLSKPYNFLLVNLMIADLVMILTNLPVAAINSLYGTWMFGQLGIIIVF